MEKAQSGAAGFRFQPKDSRLILAHMAVAFTAIFSAPSPDCFRDWSGAASSIWGR